MLNGLLKIPPDVGDVSRLVRQRNADGPDHFLRRRLLAGFFGRGLLRAGGARQML
jgi:hypothetical protein